MPNSNCKSCKKAKALRADAKARKGRIVADDRREAKQRMEESMRGRNKRRVPIVTFAPG